VSLKFSLFPLERIARQSQGLHPEDNFDDSKLPFEIVDGVYIENIAGLIPEDEFDYCKPMLGSEAVRHLEGIKYAIIHRFPCPEIDPVTGSLTLEPEVSQKSRDRVQQITACLRLIRPTPQHAQFMGGEVNPDGTLQHFHFDNPLTFIQSVPNQQLFGLRTCDIESLRFYAPLFIQAIAGNHWKFIMAVTMFQSGFFQQSDWKLRYFMWTAALEALFTSHTSDQHRGSLVAKERIKWLLGATTPIYNQGELSILDHDPQLTVEGVVDEIYCLRNHIAHGDKVPDYYFVTPGRTREDFPAISKLDVLLESISSIVRQSLLKILKDGLIQPFEDDSKSSAFFTALSLTKDLLAAAKKNAGISHFKCPK
jgi:hypothetical protein